MDRIGYPIHDRDPNAPSGSIARVVLIVVGVVLLILGLIVARFLSDASESLGGTQYLPTDKTVQAAREKADGGMRTEVDRLVSAISPTLGLPSMQAVMDGCEAARPESFSNDIACERTRYVFFTAGQEPKDVAASDLAPLIAASGGWRSFSTGCDGRPGQTTACFSGNGGVLHVTQNGASTDSHYRMPFPRRPITPVEDQGYTVLQQTVTVVPGVLIEYTVRYFSG